MTDKGRGEVKRMSSLPGGVEEKIKQTQQMNAVAREAKRATSEVSAVTIRDIISALSNPNPEDRTSLVSRLASQQEFVADLLERIDSEPELTNDPKDKEAVKKLLQDALVATAKNYTEAQRRQQPPLGAESEPKF